MQLSTSPSSWVPILELLLPRVDVVLDAIVLWVVARGRTTSAAEQRMLSSLVTSVQRSSGSPEPRGSRRGAQGRRKSSTKATTSTSPGERERPGHSGRARLDD